MKKTTHQIFSVGYFFLFSIYIKMPPMGIILGTLLSPLAGIFPDLFDYKIKIADHRNFITHSPISPLVLIFFLAVWIIGDLILLPENSLIFAFLLTSTYEFHIFLDSFNPTGVPIFPTRFYSLKRIPFDDFRLNAIFSLIGLFLFLNGCILLTF